MNIIMAHLRKSTVLFALVTLVTLSACMPAAAPQDNLYLGTFEAVYDATVRLATSAPVLVGSEEEILFTLVSQDPEAGTITVRSQSRPDAPVREHYATFVVTDNRDGSVSVSYSVRGRTEAETPTYAFGLVREVISRLDGIFLRFSSHNRTLAVAV